MAFNNQSWPSTDGTAGQFLKTNGAGVLVWATADSSIVPLSVTKTVAYTAAANELVLCTANSFTVTLPLAASNTNKSIYVVNNGTGTITIGRTGTDTVGLTTTQTLNPATATAQGDAMPFFSDGVSNWDIF